MLALRWTEINRLYWLQVIGEEAVGFNKTRALANQCTSICRRANMTSLFSEWWPRTAHTAIIHQPFPSSFLPPTISLCSQIFFFSISKYTFLFSLPLSPSITGLCIRTISSHFFCLHHLFSSSYSQSLLFPVFFPCGVSSVQRVNETAAFTPFPLFSEHFCCFVVVFGALYL